MELIFKMFKNNKVLFVNFELLLKIIRIIDLFKKLSNYKKF